MVPGLLPCAVDLAVCATALFRWLQIMRSFNELIVVKNAGFSTMCECLSFSEAHNLTRKLNAHHPRFGAERNQKS